MTYGLMAKTNFNYTKKQLLRLLENDGDFTESDLAEPEFSTTLPIPKKFLFPFQQV